MKPKIQIMRKKKNLNTQKDKIILNSSTYQLKKQEEMKRDENIPEKNKIIHKKRIITKR